MSLLALLRVQPSGENLGTLDCFKINLIDLHPLLAVPLPGVIEELSSIIAGSFQIKSQDRFTISHIERRAGQRRYSPGTACHQLDFGIDLESFRCECGQ